MIDIAPEDEGFANIARMFAEQILADVRKPRKAAARELLIGLIQTAAYIGRKDRGDLIPRMTPR